jgi:hypothetical protein
MTVPMNEQPHVKLREYVARSGFGILNDPNQCEAWLRNACPQSAWESSILIAALRQGVPSFIGNRNPAMPGPAIRAQIAQQFQSTSGFAPDAAQWGVDAWAYILGIDLNASRAQIQPQAVAPSHPQPQVRPQMQYQAQSQPQLQAQPIAQAVAYARPKLQMPDVAGRVCPYCGSAAPGQTCPACNRDTTAPRRVCAKCGRITPMTEPVCVGCQTPYRSDLMWKVPVIVALFIAAIILAIAYLGSN